MATLAKRQVINTLAKFCKGLNNVVASAEKLNPGGSSSVFVAFTPPAKSKLPRCYVDTDSLRKEGVGIRSIYHWSFSLTGVANPRPLWKAHPLPGQPSDRSCRPTVLTVSVGAKGLNWRTAYRSQTPEKLKLKLGTLSKAWRRMKDLDLQLTTRRRLWIDRAAKFAKTAAKRRAESASKRVAANQLKTSGVSSSTSSSSSGSSTSGCSVASASSGE